MIVYVLQRLLGLVPVLFGITVVIFLTMKLIPGDVARALLGPMATDQSLAQLRHALGLDEAIYVQYAKWLWRALHGDLGLSPIVHKPVVDLLLPKFGNTLILAGASFALAVVGGVAVGVLAASRQQTVVDRAAMGASLVIGNMPPFWLGLVLIVFFAINLRWLPSLGMYSSRGDGGALRPARAPDHARDRHRGRARRHHRAHDARLGARDPRARTTSRSRAPRASPSARCWACTPCGWPGRPS